MPNVTGTGRCEFRCADQKSCCVKVQLQRRLDRFWLDNAMRKLCFLPQGSSNLLWLLQRVAYLALEGLRPAKPYENRLELKWQRLGVARPRLQWRSPMAKSLFAGVILLTTTNRSCCPYRSMNSCAASYCTFFQKASCASATSAFWPTANAPRFYRFAFSCWVRNNRRKPNNTALPPKIVPTFGAALNAVDR